MVISKDMVLSRLETINKSSIVGAINEVKTDISNTVNALSTHKSEIATIIDIHKDVLATTSTIGHVKIGTNIDVTDGIISVASGTITEKGLIQLTDDTTSTSVTTAATANAVKTIADKTQTVENATAALEIKTAVLEANSGTFSSIKNNRDDNGVFTSVELRRKADGTLYQNSVLSGGISPRYDVRTITTYAVDGTTILKTEQFALSYDEDNVLVSEV